METHSRKDTPSEIGDGWALETVVSVTIETVGSVTLDSGASIPESAEPNAMFESAAEPVMIVESAEIAKQRREDIPPTRKTNIPPILFWLKIAKIAPQTVPGSMCVAPACLEPPRRLILG